MKISRRTFLGNASLACGGLLSSALISPSLAQKALVPEALFSVKEFGAKGDGIHDDSKAVARALASGNPIYFPPGRYFFADHVKPPNGARIVMIGAHRDLVTIITNPGRVCIYCDATPGIDNRILGAHIEGITFDGRHARRTFPYAGKVEESAPASMLQALNLRGPKGNDLAHVVVTRCRFQNINGLPVWIADFSGSVEFSHNHLLKCRDPGFLLNDNLKIFNNTIEFAGDNGISVSRSNRRIAVYGNHIKESAVAGIFIGGVNLEQSSINMSLSGTAYSEGQKLLLRAEDKAFNTEMIGFDLVLRSGADTAFLRCTSVTDMKTATVVALADVPPSMRGQSVRDWSVGPVPGAQYGHISGNVIEGSLAHGIHLTQGCKGLDIAGNTILRTGICADSERSTIATILAGQNLLRVQNSNGFSPGDWVVIVPDYTMENAFVSKVMQVADNGLILADTATESYIEEEVHRAGTSTGRFGVCIIGRSSPSGRNEYAEDLNVHDNAIIDFLTGAVRLGSGSGSIRRIMVHHNIMRPLATSAQRAATAVVVDDGSNPGMPISDVSITDNRIDTIEPAQAINLRLLNTSRQQNIFVDRNHYSGK